MSNCDKENHKPWYANIESKFLRSIVSPFCICCHKKHAVETFVWVMFVLVASQLGTIINLIKRWIFGGWDFQVALAPDSASGSFYTFSLVLMASLVGPWFIRIVKREKPEFRSQVIVFETILIFLILLCAVFYSFATQDVSLESLSKMHNCDMKLDGKQFFFFLIAIVCACYSYGLSLSLEHEDMLNLDFQEEDDKNRNELSGRVEKLSNKIVEGSMPSVNSAAKCESGTSTSIENIKM